MICCVFSGESGGNADGQTDGSKTDIGKTPSKTATKSATSVSKKSVEKVTDPGSDLHKTASGDAASQQQGKGASSVAGTADADEQGKNLFI